MTQVQRVLEVLDSVGYSGKHVSEARRFLDRARGLDAGFTARSEHLLTGLVDDLATGRADLEQAVEQVAVLVARHAVTNPGALAMIPGVVERAEYRCVALAWSALRQAGGDIDRHTRAHLAALDKQITTLEAKLPDHMRGTEIPTDAGRAHLIAWTDLIDTRRRRDELRQLRRELRAVDLVAPTDTEHAEEQRAEQWRLRMMRGDVVYSMSTEDARRLDSAPVAPGWDRITASGRP